MENFNMDNTEGFTLEQIAKMNERYENETADLDETDENYENECQKISERICGN